VESYRYVMPDQTLLIGPGTIASLSGELRARGIRSVALVSSPRASRSIAAEMTRAALTKVRIVARFEAVREHAPMADSERWARSLAQEPPDAMVAVGGGSASDTAKAISILLGEGGRMEDHCSVFTPPDQLEVPATPAPKIPVFAVVTTLSGAEITPGGGATTDAGVKRVFWDPKIASRVAIFDTTALSGVPDEVLLTTGMNGLAHCAEGLYSRTRNPLSSALAREGARNFAEGLLALARDDSGDAEALLTLSVAAAIGGAVISNARVGIHHALCHVLGAACGLPHGVANSVMLPFALEYNYSETARAQEALADSIRPALEASGLHSTGSPAKLVATLQRAIGVPASLRAAGLDHGLLGRVAGDVMQDRGLFFNPRRVDDSGEMQRLLENAWEGRLEEER
jgi:alcohol dehydrogenase class IV